MQDIDFENESTNKYVQLTQREAMVYGLVGMLGDLMLQGLVDEAATALILISKSFSNYKDAKKVWVSAHRKITVHAGLKDLLPKKKED